MLFFVSLCLCGCLFLVFATSAAAYTGRRAILYTRGEALLAQHIPYVRGKSDCSGMAWELLNFLKEMWPELKLTKWFHRTSAGAMAGWPWPPVMRLHDAMFGDLLFCNGSAGNPANWPLKKWHTISHVMISWDAPGTAVHASSSKGFSRTNLRPYWQPRINLVVRPPY